MSLVVWWLPGSGGDHSTSDIDPRVWTTRLAGVTTDPEALESLSGVRVLKGHGTGNDFVLVPDPDAAIELTAAQVRALADRRTGIGADGVLRVVPTAASPEVADQAGDAHWFMDYRNADGSVAETCGNGARVFARYLVDAGLEKRDDFAIATRGGTCAVRIESDGDVTIDMGTATMPALRAMPVVSVRHQSWNGSGILVPNPHCVVFVDDADELAALDLSIAPTVQPKAMFPDGVGIATSASDAVVSEELLRNADLAMYLAKSQGKGRFVVFEPKMHTALMERIELEDDLRRGIEEEEFVIHYQPILNLGTNQLVGMEALVRWMHPRHGLLAPMKFIPLAEETNLIVPLGDWILREACRQMQVWLEDYEGQFEASVTVNISIRQFQQGELVE